MRGKACKHSNRVVERNNGAIGGDLCARVERFKPHIIHM